MYSPPINYTELNILEGSYTPSTVKVNSVSFRYWCRALYQRAISTIEFKNFPEEWKEVSNRFYEWLFLYGFVAVTRTDDYGTIFNKCTLAGFNIYYEPTQVYISNPALSESLVKTLGTEASLIKLCPDYRGIADIITYYAQKLALLDSAQNTSLINSKIPFMIGAKNKAAGITLKSMLDKVNAGEPSVVFDSIVADDVKSKDTPFHKFDLFSGEDYITDKLLKDTETVINQFDAEIGIVTVPYQKAERMVTAEAESKTQDATARCQVWIRSLNDSLAEVNRIFGYNIIADMSEGSEIENG